ncbi:hypothetical protein B0H16DRAFT_295876 [Mycena metata]|uniref:Telomere-associated protein Rif1 N-terminal domain-containing protein n=1 Tax=Mycena metata TaxID=1033252 RepID=A0AAD7KFA3_9AGAR|nr:hypothetical protein B0H16DRAFT_295876 [Mycena metata]
MSLPTPPNTGHREKENRVPPRAHVIWSPNNQYRTITPTLSPHPPPAPRVTKNLPTKSILKRRSEPLLPLIDAFQRETTPEPERPKFDPTYLSSPVTTILDPAASLDDLIRAYSILAARIRANITLTTDSDASFPILQPLRKNRDALEQALVRDIARCLVNPETMDYDQTPEDMEEEACLKEQPVLLPSPKNSPKKKKKGTTAKKAKYGRDLCTTCHSAIKLLAVVFTLPAVSGVFTFPQLCSILTQVLAIPLADDLPTPNARKTYALSIWLLQSQRLPASVLEKAADRIVFALRRGIEGELGKEGKKGSASDGLKAIHDLSVYQPTIFIPRFEVLLPSVLANLLAQTAGLRTQACHALGGIARGLATLPVSSLHTRISAIVSSILDPKSSSPSTKSPPKSPSNQSPLVRIIRTTLQSTEAQNVSQGPVWGLSVVASLLVLANSATWADDETRRALSALLACSQMHKKTSVRSLGSAVWRCAVWAYCQPLLPADGDDESEVDEEEDNARSKRTTTVQHGRELFWTKVVSTVVDMGVGISIVAALLEEHGGTSEESLTRIATILKFMASKGGSNLTTAFELLEKMVSFEPTDTEWSWNKLLPRGLFSASPGLLTAEFSALETPVRAIVAQCPDVYDVRSLTREEVAQAAIFEKLVEMWRECLGYIGLQDEDPIPPHILSVWEHIIQANVAALQEEEASDADVAEFAILTVEIITDILLEPSIDITLKAGVSFCTDGQANLSNAVLKLKLVRALWAVIRKVIPGPQLLSAAEKFITVIVTHEDEFTDCGDVSRKEWAMFCAEVLIVCDPDDLKDFWAYGGKWTNAVRSMVWRCFVERWKEESECAWQGVDALLAVPFTANKSWELSDSDYDLWEAFLGRGIEKALDYGLDNISVLDHVASSIAKEHSPTSTTSSRIADLLLSHLENFHEARELPESLMEFVNDTLRSSYPPEPRNKQHALWTLRTVTRTIESCPTEFAVDLLRLLEEGLCVWLSDEHQALTETEYGYDAVCLYQGILIKVASLPILPAVLESVGCILEAGFVGRENIPTEITDAFTDFWGSTYAKHPAPARGWPAEIRTCLGIADEVDELAAPWDKVSLSPAFRGAQKVSPNGKKVPVGSPFKLGNARFRSVSLEPADETDGGSAPQEVASVVQPCRPVTPTTPVTVRSRASTPPRPHKLPSTVPSSPTSPASPVYAHYLPSTPSTPKRTPLRVVSGSKSSPNKRRKLDNKENESPRPYIASVLERIIASPSSGHDLVVSKKHASPNQRDEERPSKRSKVDGTLLGGDDLSLRSSTSPRDAEAEEERLVEFSLVEREESSPSAAGFYEGTPPLSKKRKRVLFDAVEVPSVQQVYSRAKEVVAFSLPPKQSDVVMRATSKIIVRRVSSSGSSSSLSRKRRRDSDEAPEEDPFSDNSIARERRSFESSSDDDVYFGQVTPGHVFSPALRRARDDDSDPPSSDDSSMSASPLKGVVSRRLQKAGSNGRRPVAASLAVQ